MLSIETLIAVQTRMDSGKEVIDETLADSRNQVNPLPLQSFSFESVTARFVKFEVASWYGIGGGIQYFNIKKSGIQYKYVQ